MKGLETFLFEVRNDRKKYCCYFRTPNFITPCGLDSTFKEIITLLYFFVTAPVTSETELCLTPKVYQYLTAWNSCL